jgi:hypothetical protein
MMSRTCGRQSCLQAAFQAAVSDTLQILLASAPPLAVGEAEESRAEARGTLWGGQKLALCRGRPNAENGQSPGAG